MLLHAILAYTICLGVYLGGGLANQAEGYVRMGPAADGGIGYMYQETALVQLPDLGPGQLVGTSFSVYDHSVYRVDLMVACADMSDARQVIASLRDYVSRTEGAPDSSTGTKLVWNRISPRDWASNSYSCLAGSLIGLSVNEVEGVQLVMLTYMRPDLAPPALKQQLFGWE